MIEYLQFLNVLIIPILVWVVLVERRLTRIETILRLLNNPGREKKCGKEL